MGSSGFSGLLRPMNRHVWKPTSLWNGPTTPKLLRPIPSLLSSQSLLNSFSTSSPRAAKRARMRLDSRVKLIRYFFYHPQLPRPLRFSRNRYLRHWTIHRAWQMFKAKERYENEVALERQYHSMRNACEALRLTGEDGLAVREANDKASLSASARDAASVRLRRQGSDGKDEAGMIDVDVEAAARQQKQVGRLYRISQEKKGIWNNVPIEYARSQTDFPSRSGWDHEWTPPADWAKKRR